MAKKTEIKLFQDRQVRSLWDDVQEQWYFSIADVVSILTDSADPKQYVKKMKSRDESLKSNWGTICTLVPMVSEDGKRHKEMAATTEGILRIIQSIPSPKAEPFKQWMAREELEARTGRPVVSSLSAKRFFESQKAKGIDNPDEENKD